MMQFANNYKYNQSQNNQYNNVVANNRITPTFRGNKMDKTPQYIKDIIIDLKKATSQEEMYNIFDKAVEKTSDFIAKDLTSFAGNGYQFQCTLKTYTDKYNIRKINQESGVTILDIIQIGNTDRCVVVSKAK